MKRFIAIIMILCLVLGLSSVSAWAAEDNYTKLNMHFDKDGFIDEAGHTVTLQGSESNCYISKENSKLGTGSLFVNKGLNNYLQINKSDDFNFGALPFTIEMWVYVENNTTQYFIGNNDWNNKTGWCVGWNNRPNYNDNNLHFFANGIASDVSVHVPSINTWHHLAISRVGTGNNETKIFVDGVKVGEGTIGNIQDSLNDLYIGKGYSTWNVDYLFTGYLDDIKITKGIAKYTDNFIPDDSVLKLSVLLNEEETVQLSTSYDLDNNKKFTWSSTNEAVATVDSNGKVTAITEGTANIYAQNADGTFKEYIPVKVVEGIADELRLAVHLKSGEKVKLYLADDPSQVTWSSMDESIATVSADGQITGVKRGLAIVQAELDGETYQIYVRVNG